jgi:hypothetical protein
MAERYRKLFTAVWADQKFLDLSRQRPSGQTLWLYLLLGPHTSAIPGLSHAYRSQIREALRWSNRSFVSSFAQLEMREMVETDWRRGVIWVPHGVRWNAPDNPNVVAGWRVPLREIPACPLKTKALKVLRGHCAARGLAFVEAFERATSAMVQVNRSPNRLGNRSGNRSDIQDQEQEQYSSLTLGVAGGGNTRAPRGRE